jgi:signal transduction histidine kinase
MAVPAKILLVDDNPVVLFKVAHLLKTAGFTVLEASTGRDALRLARAESPDLVLLDVRLPDINGVEVCRELKASPDTRHFFVVLLSEKETSTDSQAGGLEAGADGYIARPIENRELLARVQAMLRIQQAESELRQARDELEHRVTERTAELSQANAALTAMSLRLVEVQEAERRFIARELHDEVGQMLTGLKLILETSCHPETDAQREAMGEATGLIDELMERVRQLSVDLRPQMLDDLGLLTALDWHFQRYFKQTGVRVRFKHSPLAERLPTQLETAAFRIAQEALTNVARYAGVKEATVRLWTDGERLRVQIEDQGAGFDAEQALALPNSTGLTGMKERAQLLGGEFTLESAPGAGTRLTVELPMTAPDSSVLPRSPADDAGL